MLTLAIEQATVIHPSPIGRLLIRATPRGLSGLRLIDHDRLFDAADLPDDLDEDADFLPPLLEKIDQCLIGKLPATKVPLDVAGPPFLRRVWQELVKIPWGETVTYEELARRAGQPKAIRAAGTGCGRNPVAFIIPCHRVLAKGGGLGGYWYGLEVKRGLLRREGVEV